MDCTAKADRESKLYARQEPLRSAADTLDFHKAMNPLKDSSMAENPGSTTVANLP
jgi:hypothetical protein